MAENDKVFRIVHKRGNGLPTIPVSADHRNGDWLSTDIYEGEMYQNTANGKVYTRHGATIVNADGTPAKKTYKAKISQSGTSAPTEQTVFQNDFTGAWNYVSTGTYDFDTIGDFTDIDDVHWVVQNSDTTLVYFSASVVSNAFRLQVRDSSGTLINTEITKASILIEQIG
jgi:hypothetical protein